MHDFRLSEEYNLRLLNHESRSERGMKETMTGIRQRCVHCCRAFSLGLSLRVPVLHEERVNMDFFQIHKTGKARAHSKPVKPPV